MHGQVRGDDADDPTTYLVTFGDTEAHYMVRLHERIDSVNHYSLYIRSLETQNPDS